MLILRIGFFIAGSSLAVIQLWHGHLLLAMAGALTAVIALLGVLAGSELIGDHPVVKAAAALSLASGLAGTFGNSAATDLELQNAYIDATFYLLLAKGTCHDVPYGVVERASTACIMQGPTESVALASDLNKTLHNPSPALSILDDAKQAFNERPRNECAVAFAEVYRRCGPSFMKPQSVKRLQKEAGAGAS